MDNEKESYTDVILEFCCSDEDRSFLRSFKTCQLNTLLLQREA